MFILAVVRFLFHFYGWLWTLRSQRVESIKDVLNLFYLGFLGLDKKDVEVVRLNNFELVIRCRNPCPILRLSLMLKVDTRMACKIVSEPVCKYVLNRLNPNLVFERNYNHIRPHSESCEERIYFKS
jgi:hypothetical protein